MSKSAKTKNDAAWETLFEEHRILEKIDNDGRFVIDAGAINNLREARLMTKFDHRKNLPTIFQKHGLAILPITRGDYIIARFDTYHHIEEAGNQGIEYIPFPDHIQSITYPNITSESAAINCAYVSGILFHFLNDADLSPTVSGRMSSGSFDFNIDGLANEDPMGVQVINSQIEIDAGYEGVDSLILIEAKVSLADDFLVRQLYYPFRTWAERIAKEIRLIFLVYSNGLFYLYEYQFDDPNNYSSIRLLNHQLYSLEERNISLDDIERILDSTEPDEEPDIPFPQADLFERVINLCELLADANELTQEDVRTTYDFDKRQSGYYTDAGRYLGVVDKKNDEGIKYFLTNEGKVLLDESYKLRQLGFVAAILKHSIFSEALRLYLQKAEPPSKEEIINIMRLSGIKLSDTTLERRAQTVRNWIQWILSLQS